jgi:hypothetical protein
MGRSERERFMKKAKPTDEMRPEYDRKDLGEGVRGKYYSAFKEKHNIVLLDPEVANAFPSEEAVNEALKSLIKVARDSVDLTNR